MKLQKIPANKYKKKVFFYLVMEWQSFSKFGDKTYFLKVYFIQFFASNFTFLGYFYTENFTCNKCPLPFGKCHTPTFVSKALWY